MTTTINELVNRVSSNQTIYVADGAYNPDNINQYGQLELRDLRPVRLSVLADNLPKTTPIEVYSNVSIGYTDYANVQSEVDWSGVLYILSSRGKSLHQAIRNGYTRRNKYCINDMAREAVSPACRVWLDRDGYLSERNIMYLPGGDVDYRTNDKAKADAQAKKTIRNIKKMYAHALYGRTEGEYLEMVAKEDKRAKAREREIDIVNKHIIGDYTVRTLINRAIKTGRNDDAYNVHIGDANEVICYERLDWQGYSKSYGHPMTRRSFDLYLKRGYNVTIIGGLLTYYRGKYNREGMPCEWLTQGRAIRDLQMVKGYIVRGEHIVAKSLAEAKRISAEHRSKTAIELLNKRAAREISMAKLAKHMFTFDESIASGNCAPGTQSFKDKVEEAIGHEISEISLSDLRKYSEIFGVKYYAERVINYVAARS